MALRHFLEQHPGASAGWATQCPPKASSDSSSPTSRSFRQPSSREATKLGALISPRGVSA
jgi:hypothetical protein